MSVKYKPLLLSMYLCVCVGRRVRQTRGAGGTQVGAAGPLGEDRWALPFHDPRSIWPGPGAGMGTGTGGLGKTERGRFRLPQKPEAK